MESKQPSISVILPVYNGGSYLRAAIDSILAQTMTDFELIIINDGSADESDAVVKAFSDERIRYSYQKNQGLAATLNIAIRQARGRYIARQDQDDVSRSDRLEVEAKFLDEHSQVGIVGSWAKIMVEEEPTERVLKHPVSDVTLRFGLLFDSRLVHPSVMIRREVFDAVGFYSTDRDRQPPEDYELWSRIARRYELANLPEYLLTYREVAGSMSRDPHGVFMDKVVTISGENIAAASDRSVDDPLVRALAGLIHRPTKTTIPVDKVVRFLQSLAAKAGDSEEVQALAADQETLVRQHYPHGVLYKAARRAMRVWHKVMR